MYVLVNVICGRIRLGLVGGWGHSVLEFLGGCLWLVWFTRLHYCDTPMAFFVCCLCLFEVECVFWRAFWVPFEGLRTVGKADRPWFGGEMRMGLLVFEGAPGRCGSAQRRRGSVIVAQRPRGSGTWRKRRNSPSLAHG
jgi:hypothetical protein